MIVTLRMEFHEGSRRKRGLYRFVSFTVVDAYERLDAFAKVDSAFAEVLAAMRRLRKELGLRVYGTPRIDRYREKLKHDLARKGKLREA